MKITLVAAMVCGLASITNAGDWTEELGTTHQSSPIQYSIVSHDAPWSGQVEADHSKSSAVNEVRYGLLASLNPSWLDCLKQLGPNTATAPRYSDPWNVDANTYVSWTLLAKYTTEQGSQGFSYSENGQYVGRVKRVGGRFTFVKWDVDKVLKLPTPIDPQEPG